MAISLKHNKVVTTPDDGTSEVGSDEWNAEHTLTCATSRLLGRSSAGTGAVEELDAATARTLLGLPAVTEDTWANRPTSPVEGHRHLLTDAPSEANYVNGAWSHRVYGRRVTPPVLADFAQVNWGTSSTAAFGPFTSIIAQPANAYALRVLDKAAPATPYTIEVGLLLPLHIISSAGSRPLFGCGFRQSSDGKMHLLWYDYTSSLVRSVKMSSATAASAAYAGDQTLADLPVGLLKMRFRDDGTTRYVDLEQNDGAWKNLHSVARTDFLTPDRVCLAINIESANVADRIHWVHWKEIAGAGL